MNRDVLLSEEAAEIYRLVTSYHTLLSIQVYRMYPGREKKIRAVLTRLIHRGRLFYYPETDCLTDREKKVLPDQKTVRSFWVLLDFIDRAEYHIPGEYPAQILFFVSGELYEIIAVPGTDRTLPRILKASCPKDSRRILLIDSPEQIPALAGCASAYCTVSDSGAVSYYKTT